MELEAMGTATAIAVILVPFVSLIKRDTWSDKAKQALGLGAAFVAAIIGAVVDGNVNNLGEFIAYLGVARLVAETLYTQHFSGTALNSRLEAVGNEAKD